MKRASFPTKNSSRKSARHLPMSRARHILTIFFRDSTNDAWPMRAHHFPSKIGPANPRVFYHLNLYIFALDFVLKDLEGNATWDLKWQHNSPCISLLVVPFEVPCNADICGPWRQSPVVLRKFWNLGALRKFWSYFCYLSSLKQYFCFSNLSKCWCSIHSFLWS